MHKTDQAFLRHEILNILTVINFLLSDTPMDVGRREDLVAHLRLVALLIGHQPLILGKKNRIAQEEIPLSEVMELLKAMIEDQAKKKKVKLQITNTEMKVNSSRDVVLNGLQFIVLQLMGFSKKIAVRTDEKKRLIEVHYDSKETLKLGKEKLIDFLKKGPKPTETLCRINTELMHSIGIKTRFKKGVVEVQF